MAFEGLLEAFQRPLEVFSEHSKGLPRPFRSLLKACEGLLEAF
jgi:hypothetical protein